MKVAIRTKRWLVLIALLAMLGSLTLTAPGQAQTTTLGDGQPVVTTSRVNLRTGPGTVYPIVVEMAMGESAIVRGQVSLNGWVRLDYAGVQGWALVRYLQATGPAPTATPVTTPPQPTALPTSTPVTEPPATTANPDNLWLGVLNAPANVRPAPTTYTSTLKTWPAGRKVILYGEVTGAVVAGNNRWYQVGIQPEREQNYYIHSSLVNRVEPLVIPIEQEAGRWIDVNLSQQTLIAFEGARPVMYTLISSGKDAKNLTEAGRWRIYYRVEKQTMESREVDKFSPEYYSLKDVPYPQYFHNSGEALHGTFWHDNFGSPRSHGCVNLTIPASEWIYKNFTNIGTLVYVHY